MEKTQKKSSASPKIWNGETFGKALNEGLAKLGLPPTTHIKEPQPGDQYEVIFYPFQKKDKKIKLN